MGNQIYNLILLLLIGVLIYYLSRPSNIDEKFTDLSMTNPPTENNGYDETYDMPTEMVSTQIPNAKANITQDMINQIISETENPMNTPGMNMPDMNTSGMNATGMDIESFKPNLDTNGMGAELMGAEILEAFDKLDIPMLTPETVNVNKNNVSQYNSKDFLPKEINDQWFDTDFSQAKFNINDDKLINTDRYIIGINTVGQSLKNASYDIRGAIPNPKYSVSPWNNSTIEADYNIKPLC